MVGNRPRDGILDKHTGGSVTLNSLFSKECKESIHCPRKSTWDLASLKTLKNIVSQSQLSNVYRALVESHIRYADVIWGNLSNSKMKSLQRFQDRAISIIDTARIKDDWSKNFLQVKQLITFYRSVMTYKIMNRLCPEDLGNNFQRRSH